MPKTSVTPLPQLPTDDLRDKDFTKTLSKKQLKVLTNLFTRVKECTNAEEVDDEVSKSQLNCQKGKG